MKRNVALLCLDTVRQDYFAEHAPRLLDAADVTYEQCRAASSWSVPSHASMFTGELPCDHGIHTHNRSFAGLTRADTFLGELPDYTAVGTSANVWAGSPFGFDGLFDAFSDVSPDRRFPDGLDVARFGQDHPEDGLGKYLAFVREAAAHGHPVKSLANGALVQLDDWLARAPVPKLLDDGAKTIARESLSTVDSTPEPFFLFANFMDAHGPLHHVRGFDRELHDAPYSWTSEDVHWPSVLEDGERELLDRYRDLYAASIDYLDRRVNAFVDALRERTDRETVVVVTSDHGDNFGTSADDGHWGHVRSSLTEGLLHVPQLIIGAPQAGDRTVETRTSHLELGRLLVGLANGDLPDVTADRVAAERLGYSGHRENLGEAVEEYHDRALRCVYDDDRKFLWDSEGGRTTYRLDADRPCWQEPVDESFDVDDLEPAHFGEHIDEAKRRAARAGTRQDVDAGTADRLRDLGYM